MKERNRIFNGGGGGRESHWRDENAKWYSLKSKSVFNCGNSVYDERVFFCKESESENSLWQSGC